MSKKIFHEAIRQFSSKHILVIGDIMLDEYTIGTIARISPEAPVPVLTKKQTKHVLGGAANAAANMAALGATVSIIGTIGADDHGGVVVRQLLLEQGIHTDALVSLSYKPTTVKHRFVAQGQHVLRCDTEDASPLLPEEIEHMLQHVKQGIAQYDAVLCSDYQKGVFSESLAQEVIRMAHEKGIPVIVDTKAKHKDFFRDADIIKPNAKEVREMTGVENLEQAGATLSRTLNANVIVTAGGDGMIVCAKDNPDSSTAIPVHNVPVVDITGAGDTSAAIITLGYASGLSLEESATLANYGASFVVQKVGTATVSVLELMSITENTSHIDTVEIVPKLWGHEKWLENNDQYCSKQLVLNKGYQCSLHYHKIKDEMFLVTKGYVRMEVGEEIMYMKPGSFVRIHPGTPHRFRGLEDSEILEISTTHMEEDSYRIEPSCKVEPDMERL